jgi:hypothetical protein
MNQRLEKVVPLGGGSRDQRQNETDPLDRSGFAIVSMLQDAVTIAKQDCERAMDVAHKLSLKLRESEDRIAQLEANCRHYQERAQRAEQWMNRIQSEIEDRFFKNAGTDHGSSAQGGNGRSANGQRPSGHASNTQASNGQAPR